MDDFSVMIQGIEYKTHQLIKKLEALVIENQKLKEHITELVTTQAENQNKIKVLQNQNQIITITNAIEGEENKTKAKKKINELLREVDRCLALINK